MPRFFFHLHDCGRLVSDEEGREFPSIEAAVARAQIEARELLADEIRDGRLCLGCQIEVVEETTGRTIIVPFSSTVQLQSAVVERSNALLVELPPPAKHEP
jgi:hypothetical protein